MSEAEEMERERKAIERLIRSIQEREDSLVQKECAVLMLAFFVMCATIFLTACTGTQLNQAADIADGIASAAPAVPHPASAAVGLGLNVFAIICRFIGQQVSDKGGGK